MATVIGQNQVKLDNGQVITPQTGGWYDGQQYWNGTLSQPGQINSQSNQPGAGGLVSNEVIAQTNPANVAYIQQQRAKMNLAPSPSTGVPASQPTSQPAQSSGAGVDTSFFNQPTIDLPGLYEDLYAKSGVYDLEKKMTAYTEDFNTAQSKINDNPFLSEASRVGRIQKLQTDYNNNTAGIRNDIATRKADIETRMNIQTKQFDINSQQATQALSQFQTLLQAGALDNASGEDIANITRGTGLSSSMIQSAINANKDKNIKTSVIEYDDGTNQGFMVINSQTGQIINKEVVAASTKTSGGGTVTERKEADLIATQNNLIADIQAGSTLRQLVGHYTGAGGLTVEEVYRLYNTYSPYGTANESLDQVKEGKYKDQ